MNASRGRDDRFLVAEMNRHLAVIALARKGGRDRLSSDVEARYALEHAVELLAEAAKKTSSSFRESNHEIDWMRIRGLRRVVAHPYEADAEPIEMDELWVFARDDAPGLLRALKRVKFPRSA